MDCDLFLGVFVVLRFFFFFQVSFEEVEYAVYLFIFFSVTYFFLFFFRGLLLLL